MFDSTGRVGDGDRSKEGAALGVALLMALVKGEPGGALTTLVSTHHGLLKNLACDHQFFEEERGYSVFENASMEFDDKALVPTYRLIMGVPRAMLSTLLRDWGWI